jgi:5'-3' exonuclease
MPKSKLTLIVDGNWLLMSRLSVLNNRFADEYELNQELKLMLIKSINKVLRLFPVIDNVIFVADG